MTMARYTPPSTNSATGRLDDEQAATARANFAEGLASLACEGIYLTPEELTLFECFDRERVSHKESRQELLDHTRRSYAAKAHAAE